MSSEMVGVLALVVSILALVRASTLKLGPNLTKPLEDEIESLQSGRNKDRIEAVKLTQEVKKRDTVIDKLRNANRSMRVAITLLRNQLRAAGIVPGYGAEFETGPLEGNDDE